MRLLFVGFGTVGQGLSELLIEKRDELAASYGFDAEVVGIADMLKGSAYDPDGLDLAEALARVGRGESLSDWPGAGRSWDALDHDRPRPKPTPCSRPPTPTSRPASPPPATSAPPSSAACT